MSPHVCFPLKELLQGCALQQLNFYILNNHPLYPLFDSFNVYICHRAHTEEPLTTCGVMSLVPNMVTR